MGKSRKEALVAVQRFPEGNLPTESASVVDALRLEQKPWLLTSPIYQRLLFHQCNTSPLFRLVRGREPPRTLNRAVSIHGSFSCSGPRCMALEKKNSQKTKKKNPTGICIFDVVLRLWFVQSRRAHADLKRIRRRF